MPRIFNTSGSKLSPVTQRPSAHLTLRETNSQGEAVGHGVGGGRHVASVLLLLVVLLLMQPYGALERIRDSKIKEK